MRKKVFVIPLLLLGFLYGCDDDPEENPLQDILDKLQSEIYSFYEEGEIAYPSTVTYVRKQEGIRAGNSFAAEYEVRVDNSDYAYFSNSYPATSNPYSSEEEGNNEEGQVTEQDYYWIKDGTYYLTTYRNFMVADDDPSTGQTTIANYPYSRDDFIDAVNGVYQDDVLARVNSCFNYLETIIDYGSEFYDADINVIETAEDTLIVEANNIQSYLDNVSINCSYTLEFDVDSVLPLGLSADIVNTDSVYQTSDKYINISVESSFDWSTPEHIDAPGQEVTSSES